MSPLLLLAAAALAETPAVDPFEEPDESELFRLDEQLVTVASRYAQTLRKAPSIVDLVTADDIRARGYRTVADALRDLPGIYVWKSQEGRDIATFRGVVSADNNKVLVMVDGVPWYDGVYTHAFVGDYLPISHVKQIEVIKGPGSSVYGTNAFSGVVNIVTWDGADLDGARVRWIVGSNARSDLTAIAGGRDTIGGIPVEMSSYVRVFSQSGDGLDVTPRDRHDVNGLDPKRGVSVGARLEVENLRLQLHHVDYTHSFLINEADGPDGVANKDIDDFSLMYRDTFFEARYAVELDAVTIAPHIWSQRHDNPGSYFFDTGISTVFEPDGTFTTEQHTTTVETEKDTRRGGGGIDVEAHPAIDHVTVGGVGVETTSVLEVVDRQFVDGSHHPVLTGFQAPERAMLVNAFGYAQHTWTMLPELEITAGGRLDVRLPPLRMDDGGEWETQAVVSPRAGVLWVPSDVVTAKLLYGRAFRAPAVRELLVVAPFDEEDGTYEFASGTLRVKPETIQTVEAEVSARPLDLVEGRLGASYSRLTNEIDKVNPPNEYQNLAGGLDIVGAEAAAQLELDPVEVSAAYALTLARYTRDAANPYSDRRQYEFPPHMLKGRVRADLTDNLSAVLLGELYGGRPRAEWSPTAGLADGRPFGLVHMAVRTRRLGPEDRVDLTVSARNLLNSTWGTGVYRDDADIGAPGDPRYPSEMEGEGRSVHVGVEVKL